MQVLRGLKQFYDFVVTKPFIVLWGTIPLMILVTSSFFFSNIAVILGLIYWLTKNLKLIKWITFFHLVFFILNVFQILYYRMTSISASDIWKHSFGSDLFLNLYNIFNLISIGFVITSFLFLINLFQAFIRKVVS